MEHDSFLLHLISNAQPDLYNNKSSHFKTLLDSAIDFPQSESWEVGLKEFGYVNNIDTVVNDHTIRVEKIYNTESLSSQVTKKVALWSRRRGIGYLCEYAVPRRSPILLNKQQSGAEYSSCFGDYLGTDEGF